METLSQLLKRTIRQGAPLYNDGKKQECYELYMAAAQWAHNSPEIAESATGDILEQAIQEATEVSDENNHGEAAWILRRCFDRILESEDSSSSSVPRIFAAFGGGGREGDASTEAKKEEEDSSYYYWQDERSEARTSQEKGQALANIAYLLRATIQPQPTARYYTRTFKDCFPASQAVEVLTMLGLARHRQHATERLQLLRKARFLVPVSHPAERTFRDGTHLYRFPDRAELQESLDEFQQQTDKENEDSDALCIALETTLETISLADMDPHDHGDGENDSENSSKQHRLGSRRFAGVSVRHLQPRSSVMSPEHTHGYTLAQLAATVEQTVDIKTRQHAFKQYPDCFVGQEAVSKLVRVGLAKDRSEAVRQLSQLLDVGLIHHVTYEHDFEDKYLFYEFTSVKELKVALDAQAALLNSSNSNRSDLANSSNDPEQIVRLTALVQRYKQFAGLDVTKILNQFFGCSGPEGWDTLDLQNWRDNLKRWGFGRREDQDDDMVDALSPLVVNIDPETWNVEGDDEWESPYGILAQIALFDQIPRSAFRGTPEAFKWDQLAIRATKVALEKGYFETAFKSTLNQFVLLLPLEHSESWEDQKLGVSLLLNMLSTVAVQDEGLSDYEIVKRLEFSKRLATAFLEHAQVIAKFQRYPHRNQPLSRTHTLEERIWLASDLVPRWAKSQNPEDRRNVIQLPVIPLKKFTKR